jgi:hypothetical protein
MAYLYEFAALVPKVSHALFRCKNFGLPLTRLVYNMNTLNASLECSQKMTMRSRHIHPTSFHWSASCQKMMSHRKQYCTETDDEITETEEQSDKPDSKKNPKFIVLKQIVDEMKLEHNDRLNKGQNFDIDWNQFAKKTVTALNLRDENMWLLSLMSAMTFDVDVYPIGQELVKFARTQGMHVSPMVLCALAAVCAKDTTLQAETKQTEILALFDEIVERTKILDQFSIINLIQAVSVTSKWRECFDKILSGEFIKIPDGDFLLKMYEAMLPCLLRKKGHEVLLDQVCDYMVIRGHYGTLNFIMMHCLPMTDSAGDEDLLQRILITIARHSIVVEEQLATKIEEIISRYEVK